MDITYNARVIREILRRLETGEPLVYEEIRHVAETNRPVPEEPGEMKESA